MIVPLWVNHNTPEQKTSLLKPITRIMTRTANTPTESHTLVAFRVEVDLMVTVKALAQAEDRSVSAVIRKALRAYTRQQRDDNPSD